MRWLVFNAFRIFCVLSFSEYATQIASFIIAGNSETTSSSIGSGFKMVSELFESSFDIGPSVLRSLTPYQQLMLNRLAGGRIVVLGGEECQRSRGETGLLSNSRNGNDVQ